MSDIEKFDEECRENARAMAADAGLKQETMDWMVRTCNYKYTYNFRWLGLPVIQLPQDLMAIQEIIWATRPSLVIETGVARGGSMVFYASLLAMLGGDRRVLGIDIDIRAHNRAAIESHPLASKITLLQGSSVDPAIVAQAREHARGRDVVLVVLDSNHTHAHVLAELEAYSSLVTPGSYLIVLDTIVADMPDGFYKDRPWGPRDNPKTAVHAFLEKRKDFAIDRDLEAKLLLTVAPDGYLKRVLA